MNKIKKALLLTLSLAMSATLFAACKDKNNGGATSSSDTSSEVSTPVEDSSVEDSSVEDSSVEDSSVEDSSVEDSSVEDSSVEDSSVEDSSVEDSSVEDSSVEDSSVEDSSVEDSSVEDGGDEEGDDVTAPVFSEIDTTVFDGLNVGDSIMIPEVTATDETDGEVEVYASFGTMKYQRPVMMGEEFVMDLDGAYLLKYVAQDAAGNVAEMTISVEVSVPPSVSAVLPAATANTDATSGTIVATNNGWETTTDYELADGYAHIINYSGESRVDNWFMAYGEGKLLWLVDDNDGYGVYKPYYDTVAEMANGYAFETIFDYENTYYGVEEFVAVIYSLSEEKVESWANGVYTFSLVYINENNTKYEVTVDFTLGSNSMMNKVDIAIDSYYAEEDGSYLEEPDAVRTFAITQSSGDDVVVAYDPAEVLVSSYTIKDAEGAEVSELNLVAGEQVTLSMADVPETCVAKWDTFNVTVVDGEGVEVDESVLSVYVSTYYDPEINVTGYVAGEYTITIESGFVTKTLTATVVLPETTEIYAKANKWAYGEMTSAEIYADGALNFVVVANEYADASAAIEITASPDGSEAYVEDNGDGSWTFYPDYAGEYELTIVSIANEELSSTIMVTVNECPDLSEIINGEYQNSDKAKDKQLYVMMMEVDDKIGQVFVTLDMAMYGWDGSVEAMIHQYCLYDFEYDEDSRTFALTAYTEEDMNDIGVSEAYPGYTYSDTVLTSMELTADYELKLVYYNANQITTVVPYAELTPMQWVAGDYACPIDDENQYTLRVWDDGTASLTKDVWNPMWWGWSPESGVEFRFTVSDAFVMTVSEISYGEMGDFAVGTTLTYDQDAGTITVTISETEYIFA